jgi:two-component system OmpR family sensor kinase
MSQDALPRRRRPGWRPGRPSLTVRLAAAVTCLLAAGAVIIVVAGGLATRDHLIRQARQELRGYAGQLARHPFLLTPLSRTAPGAPSLGAVAPAGAGPLSIEVRGAGGELVMRVGPGRLAGPGLSVAEPVRYRAHRIPYAYSAEDFALDVTSPAGSGAAGTLVVTLNLARIGQATSHLTAVVLAASGLAVLAAGGLAAWMVRTMLRRLTRLPPALSTGLARPGPAGDPAGAGAAARRAAGRQRQAIADTGRELRTPLSVLDGLAEYYRHRGQLSAAEFGGLMDRVARETARIGTLADALERAGRDQTTPPAPGENVSRGA